MKKIFATIAVLGMLSPIFVHAQSIDQMSSNQIKALLISLMQQVIALEQQLLASESLQTATSIVTIQNSAVPSTTITVIQSPNVSPVVTTTTAIGAPDLGSVTTSTPTTTIVQTPPQVVSGTCQISVNWISSDNINYSPRFSITKSGGSSNFDSGWIGGGGLNFFQVGSAFRPDIFIFPYVQSTSTVYWANWLDGTKCVSQ